MKIDPAKLIELLKKIREPFNRKIEISGLSKAEVSDIDFAFGQLDTLIEMLGWEVEKKE
jgi:hypothetical protein